jgi:PAS domain S-box-containing protein
LLFGPSAQALNAKTSPESTPDRTEGPRRDAVPFIILAVLALALTVVWVDTWRTARNAEEQAVNAALALVGREANQVASEWEARLERIRVLHGFARAVSRAVIDHDPRLPETMTDMRRDLELAGPEFIQAGGIRPDGFVSWTNLDVMSNAIDLSKREHFLAIARDGRDQIIGAPVRGKVSGKWTIQSAEAMRGPGGRLEQVTVISIDTAIIRSLTRYFDNADASSVSLMRRDGVVLARVPETLIGDRIALSGTATEEASEQPDKAAVKLARSNVDGVRRFRGARAIPNSDMIISVGIDESIALGPTWEGNRRALWTSSELSLLCCALAFTVGVSHSRRRAMRLREASLARTQQEEALLHRIANRASDIIVLIDGGARIIYHNDAFSRLTGKPTEALTRAPFERQMIADDQPIIHGALVALEREGGSQRFTTRIYDAEGAFRWLETELVLVQSQRGGSDERCRYIAIGRDVTSRVQDEARLRRVDAELRAMAQSSSGAMFRAELRRDGIAHGVIGAGNPGILAGYTKEDWRAPGFLTKVVVRADIPAVMRFRDTLLKDQSATVEYRVVHKDGHQVWHRNTSQLIPRGNGTAYISGYILDITAEKAQAAQLADAHRMISLGEMTSGISHELGQPLTVISMAAETARLAITGTSLRPEIAARKLDQILTMVNRARAIIDGMRKNRRAESESTEPQSLNEIVTESSQVLAARLEQEGVRLTIDMPSSLPKVRGSKLLFEQVVINLIANACDVYRDNPAIAPRRRTIKVTGAAAGGSVTLAVTDQAGGIPEAIIDRVFEPFFTTKGAGSGTGLGLSVCYGIITQAGGTLTVRNVNDGARFEIRLPVPADTRAVAVAVA